MLTLIVFIPLIAALALLFLQEDNKALIRMVAMCASGVSFLLSIGLLLAFDSNLST